MKEEQTNKIINNFKTNSNIGAIQELIQEGEKNKEIQLVKNILAEGEKIKKIAKYTGLPELEIQSLKRYK